MIKCDKVWLKMYLILHLCWDTLGGPNLGVKRCPPLQVQWNKNFLNEIMLRKKVKVK